MCVCACVLQVCNALHHLPHCIRYMQGLRDRDVYRFCAIPQIMAIGTLALCYNNTAVFEGEHQQQEAQQVQACLQCQPNSHKEQPHLW